MNQQERHPLGVLPWHSFELSVEAALPAILEVVAVTTERRVRWRGASGRTCEFDVVARAPGRVWLVECKNWQRPVSFDQVTGLIARWQDVVPTAAGVDVRSIMVSRAGYEASAVEAVHQAHVWPNADPSALRLLQFSGHAYGDQVLLTEWVHGSRPRTSSLGMLQRDGSELDVEGVLHDLEYSARGPELIGDGLVALRCLRPQDATARVPLLEGIANRFFNWGAFDDALALARELEHCTPAAGAMALRQNALVRLLCGYNLQQRRRPGARPHVAQIVRFPERLGDRSDVDPQQWIFATIFAGTTLAEQGEAAAGMATLRAARRVVESPRAEGFAGPLRHPEWTAINVLGRMAQFTPGDHHEALIGAASHLVDSLQPRHRVMGLDLISVATAARTASLT